MKDDKVEKVFAKLKEQTPHPRTSLDYRDPFTLLVAVVLSAQSTDKGVNLVTPQLFDKAPTPAAMVALGVEAITSCIRTLGLYRNKAKHVWQLSQMLVDTFHHQVPDRREDLESLPGVGRKTANVVLNVVFGQPTIPVDTHVFRVARRLGFSQADHVRDVEDDLEKQVPDHWKYEAHHLLLEHGRHICQARRPQCERCVVSTWCPTYNESSET